MLEDLYREHVNTLQRETQHFLSELDLDGMVISSGTPLQYFEDDQQAPFRTSPHFAHWLPLDGSGHLLFVPRDDTPTLIRVSPDDYWYEPIPRDLPFWAAAFEVKDVGNTEDAFQQIPISRNTAYIGDDSKLAGKMGFARTQIHPQELVSRLHWLRSFKTGYEVECMRLATESAAKGHLAAKRAFEAGKSELEIHFAFVQAVGCPEESLPYQTIVALDQKGAILHYTNKRTDSFGKVLLIDSGASQFHYACDITRTWTTTEADPRFRNMVVEFDQLQRKLCDLVKPGLPYGELHHRAHELIADLLATTGILKGDPNSAVEEGLTKPFFPHGLGHFLGLQVHDVAGHQATPAGGETPPPKQHPFLRTTRTIEENQVFTVEPGLYFIDMLLEPIREGPDKHRLDWALIDELRPCGGVRVEDNVVVTKDGHRNLTREFL